MSPVDVKPLSAARKDDYLDFFDKRAFTDNPRWAGCYCYFPYHDPAKTHWPERSGEENRNAICACIDAGSAMGYLAYVDRQVVGWCNAAPRRLYPMLRARRWGLNLDWFRARMSEENCLVFTSHAREKRTGQRKSSS